jgi:hypothetical protein
MNEVLLSASGTYTVLVSDCGGTNSGVYALFSQRTNNPAGGVALAFGGQPQTGTIASAAQSNGYTFNANANADIYLAMTTTLGSLVPKILVYKPDGKLLVSNYSGSPWSCGGSTLQMNTITIPATGTYTVLVSDCSNTNTGNYAIYAQITDKPTSPVGVILGQAQVGSILRAAESDTFTLSGNPNDVVEFSMAVTNGNLVPKIRIYKPDGKLLASNYSGSPWNCGGSTVQLTGVTLPEAGTYTLLVGDCGDTNTGSYVI